MLGCELRKLKFAVSQQHQLDLDRAVVIFPHLKNLEKHLTYTILYRASIEADISILLNDVGNSRPEAVGAAAAAAGIGLCHSYTRLDSCEWEEVWLPDSLVYGIGYTNNSLMVTLSPFQASRKAFDWVMDREWDLGRINSGSESWRSGVRKALRKLPSTLTGRQITDVLLMGEAAVDDEFLGMLKDALWDMHPDQPSASMVCNATVVDPTFAAALGAAELAKRVMESPDGCVERKYCKWWRRLLG
ncbi:MAG: hypothetical protein Q9165_005669 [Trypethelium subeluteriae]